jgi:nitroreductase
MSNPTLDTLMSHRSIRKFQDRPVEPELVDQMLHAGIRGATSYNLQNYALLVVDDTEKKEALGLAHVPLVVIALVDQNRLSRWFAVNNAGPSCFSGAHNLFIAFWDAIIALQNIVVAAESLGLGTCYYGHILGVNVQALFGTPEYVFPAGMVAIGHPDECPTLNTRLPLEAVVHYNRYQLPSDPDIRRWYAQSDADWDALSNQQRAHLAEQGIQIPKRGYGRVAPNMAQKLAEEGCSARFIEDRSADIVRNLQRARFVLEADKAQR